MPRCAPHPPSPVRNLFTMKMNTIKLIFAILSLVLCAIIPAAAEDEPQKMSVIFVNEHPRDEITLYWVNGELDEDHPERLVSLIMDLYDIYA